MKKFLVLLLALCIPFFFGIAEGDTANEQTVVEAAQDETLTVENCEELAVILQLKNENDERIKAFAENYAGETIEFDGNIAYISPHGSYKTRYDILIYAGDYSETSASGPSFQFSDVGVYNLGFSELDLPEFVRIGSNIHVIAKVKKYKEVSGLFMLDPISISPREESTSDKLDASSYSTLEKGSKGEEVKALQQQLIELYYLNDIADGSFGNKTQAAVEKFQKKNELEVTGIADPMTQAILFSEQAVENTLSVSRSSIILGYNATTAWYVDGQEFTLKNNQTKTIETFWGTYKFDAFGNYEKVGE